MTRTGSHGVLSPKSQVPSHEVNPCKLNSRERRIWHLPLHTRFQVLSPNYDVDAYMAKKLEVRLGDLWCNWVEQSARPNSQPKSCVLFWHKIMMINHVLLITWGSQVGTLPPTWDLGLGTPCEPTLRLDKILCNCSLNEALWSIYHRGLSTHLYKCQNVVSTWDTTRS